MTRMCLNISLKSISRAAGQLKSRMLFNCRLRPFASRCSTASPPPYSTKASDVPVQFESKIESQKDLPPAYDSEPARDVPSHGRHTVDFHPALKNSLPVHETLSIAAFIHANPSRWRFLRYESAGSAEWEFFRGVMWNDDPSCHLFEDDAHTNRRFNSGFDFGVNFELANAKAELGETLNGATFDLRSGSLLGRSHFYDLQFLHGMATEAGEDPCDTFSKVMLWCQTMYKLAVGDGIDPDTRICDLPVESNGYRLTDVFDESTEVTGSDTLFTLLTNNTRYEQVDLQHRALGSLLHTIQDSYAQGHVCRQDAKIDGKILANSGSIMSFQCNLGQNAKQHAHFDNFDVSTTSPERLDDFNSLPGARAAIQACSKIISFWEAGKPWQSEVESFLADEVFDIDPAVRPSSTGV